MGVPGILSCNQPAPYRYPHYHLASDTPDKLDYARLAQVVQGLGAMIWDLAQE